MRVKNQIKFFSYYCRQELVRIPNDERGLMRAWRFAKDIWGCVNCFIEAYENKDLSSLIEGFV